MDETGWKGPRTTQGFPPESGVSSDYQLLETGHIGPGQAEPVGISSLSPHCLDRTQTCWQFLPWALSLALVGLGFDQLAE